MCKVYFRFKSDAEGCREREDCRKFIKKVYLQKGGRKMNWKCKHCGETFNSSTPRIYCDRCKPKVVACICCKTEIYVMSMIQIEVGKYLCGNCFKAHYFTCNRCGNYKALKERVDVGWKGVNIHFVCADCAQKVFLCPTCRQVISSTGKGEDGKHCIRCIEIAKRPHRELEGSDFRPVPKMIGKGGPYYGIELEVDNPFRDMDNSKITELAWNRVACMKELGKLITASGKVFYVKSDGSLRNGLEIVSHPHTIQAWDAQKWLREACQLVKDYGGGSFNTETCGVHVHRGKDDLTDLHLSMLVVLFVRLQPYFEKVAQRRENGYCRYAFFTDKNDGRALNGKVIYKSIKDAKGSAVHRYQAINLQNIETIECRIFRGTLFTGSLLAYIHFTHMLCEFVKNKGTVLGKLLRYSVQDLWEMVYEFMAIDPVLKTYLDEKKITKRGTKAAEKVVPVPRDREYEQEHRIADDLERGIREVLSA
jgi:hypothetical protein